jgi:hypothetical protein
MANIFFADARVDVSRRMLRRNNVNNAVLNWRLLLALALNAAAWVGIVTLAGRIV